MCDIKLLILKFNNSSLMEDINIRQKATEKIQDFVQ